MGAAEPIDRSPRALLLTGIQGSGKTTVGRALAERLSRSAFIEGDALWKMVVGDRADMSGDPTPEALAQLDLRFRHGALLSGSFVRAGFVAIHVDNVYGPRIIEQLAMLDVPAALVVLRPSPAAVVRRERDRGTSAYVGWVDGSGDDGLRAAVERFDLWLVEGAPADQGLWLDTSEQTVDETVDAILARWEEAVVPLETTPP